MNKNRILIAGLVMALGAAGANASGISGYVGLDAGVTFSKTKVARQTHGTAAIETLLKAHEPKSKKKCQFTPELLIGFEGIIKKHFVVGLEVHGSKRCGKIKIPYNGLVHEGATGKSEDGNAANVEPVAGSGVGKTDNVCIKQRWGLTPLLKIGFLVKDHLMVGLLGGVNVNSHKLSYTVNDKRDATYAPTTDTSVYHKEAIKASPVLGMVIGYKLNKNLEFTFQYRCEFNIKHDLPRELSERTIANAVAADNVANNQKLSNGHAFGNAKSFKTMNHVFLLGLRAAIHVPAA
jgi:hypothetical protein